MLSLPPLALVALCGLTLGAADDRPRPTAFQGSLEAAQELALERNTPLVLVIVQEGEEANERFRDGLLFSDEFVEAMADSLLVLVNDGAHEMIEKRIEVDGRRQTIRVCEAYHTPNCEEHRRNWDAVARAYSENGLVRTPQVVIARPNAEVHRRVHDVPPNGVAPYVAALQEVQRAAGPSLTREQVIAVRNLLPRARTASADADWLSAHALWGEILTHARGGVYAEEARPALERALGGLRELLSSTLARMEEGEVREGYELLLELVPALEGTELEREASRTLRNVERRREWKDVIDTVKREREAMELLDEVEAHVQAGDRTKALRPLRKLMRRFEGTPAYERALRRYPGLVEELGLDDDAR